MYIHTVLKIVQVDAKKEVSKFYNVNIKGPSSMHAVIANTVNTLYQLECEAIFFSLQACMHATIQSDSETFPLFSDNSHTHPTSFTIIENDNNNIIWLINIFMQDVDSCL